MLAPEFLTGFQARRFPLVVDDAHWASRLEAQGWQTLPLATLERTEFHSDGSSPLVVVASRLSTTEQLRRLWGEQTVPICHLSLAKFDAQLEVLELILASLRAWDVEATLAERQRQYQALLSAQICRVQTGGSRKQRAPGASSAPTEPHNAQPAQSLICRIHDEVEVANMGELLEPGHLYALSEFGEAALVNLSGPAASFSLSGVLCFDDFSSLSNTEAQQHFYPSLAALRQKTHSGPNRLVLEKNQLIHVEIGGRDCTEQLHTLFADCLDDPEWGLAATEVGMGCTQSRLPLDCGQNTPFNRGRTGFFVGIGRGARIPHLDFIAWDATCELESGT